MFESLPDPKPDAILGLMTAYREDPRDDKLDLGVGVYKDAKGATPVMRAIREAERRLVEEQTTKSYVGPTGSDAFCRAMLAQVFGADADVTTRRAVQAVGGSGALRIIADFLHGVKPDATAWMSDPSWPNHGPIMSAAGFATRQYRYYDAATGRVDLDGMLGDLEQAAAGDIVIVHGCCHNPTGADLDHDAWDRFASLVESRGLFAFVDLAYQGFGDGLDADAAGVRLLAERLPELAVAASCSKNFGVYRERVGAALIQTRDADSANRARAQLGSVCRANYSMPPDHGATAVERVMGDPELERDWRQELESMRTRMNTLRDDFAAALRKRSNSDRFDYIASQKGMFSRLPLDKRQIERLRDEHGVYIVGDGRFNVAGLPGEKLDELAQRIVSVL